MSDIADEAQCARFTAREFVARLSRELGAALDPFLAERIAFGFEMDTCVVGATARGLRQRCLASRVLARKR